MKSIFGRFSRKVMTVLIALSMVTAPYGFTQHRVNDGQRRLLFDHEAHVSSIVDNIVESNGLEDFGQTINPGTGELSFRHVDIELLGDSDFDISFVRYISSDPDRPNFHGNASSSSSRGLGNWSSDFPNIVLPSIKSNGTPGCISDSTEVDIKDEMFVSPRIRIKGKTYSLLKKSETKSSTVFGTDIPDYTTPSLIKVEQTRSGNTCKWTATTTTGTVYEFGQVRVMEEKKGKKKHAVLITKVTDVNGNYANYTYEGSQHRLKWVRANDGRTLEIVYNRAGTMIECVVANSGSKTTKKRVWFYKFRKMSNSNLQYLYKAGVNTTNFYWEFDELAGIHRQYGNEYARRCSFGKNARVRNPLGLVAEYKTKKIINFVQAESPNGHKSTSHRAACIPPTDFHDKVFRELHEFQGEYELEYEQALKSQSLADGTSSYGNFSSFFTSAVTEIKITEIDQSVSTWTIQYGEHDLYNPNFSENTDRTVHKNKNSPVYVDITKPKTRTLIDPLGTKTVYKVGRSLQDTGLIVSLDVYAKNTTKAIYSAKYGYTHSSSLGTAWNRDRLNQTVAEKWTRRSKETIIVDGETYITTYEFDDYGFPVKTTRSSTLQTDKIVEKTTYTHLKSKWILGLVKTHSKNGKELAGYSYDKNGRKILETRFGYQYMKYQWSGGRLTSERNGGDETTYHSIYKRGVSQNTRLENGALYRNVVDDNGWITQTTSPTGYIEKISHNALGWPTKIDRMSGYADTTIQYSAPIYNSVRGFVIRTGMVKTESTGSGTSKKIVKTTYNGRGLPVLIETRDSTTQTSIYTRIRYDKLGREVFRSFPSYQSAATAGVETKYDPINRKIQKRENVSPNATETYTYLSDNAIRTTDAEGNSTTAFSSGYGSPYDGKETKVVEANGRVTYRTYDKLQNLTEERQVAGGETRTSTFRYNSRNQLCFESYPDTATKATEYNDAGRKSRVEYGVADNYVCKEPSKVLITSLSAYKKCTTQNWLVQIRGWPEIDYEVQEITTCKYVFPKTKIEIANEKNQTNVPNTNPPAKTTVYPVKCLPTYYWNGRTCVTSYPRFGPYFSETVEKGILFTHNPLGQVTSINYPSDSTPDITKEYDLEGRVTKIVSGNVTLTYTYGKRGELLTETLKIVETSADDSKVTKTFKATYTYNKTLGLATYKTPRNRLIKYVLNAFNQPTSFTINGQTYISQVEYHENGDIKKAQLHNTIKSENTQKIEFSSLLNSRLLPSKYQLKDKNGAKFSFSMNYDKIKRIKTVSSNLPSADRIGDRVYSYDNISQVISVSGDSKSRTFQYDGFENLLKQKRDNKSQRNVFDKTTKLLIESKYETQAGNPISHDEHGRIVNLGDFNIKFDDASRVVSIKEKGNKFLQNNMHDGNNNRVKATFEDKPSETNNPKSDNYRFISISGRSLHEVIEHENVPPSSGIFGGIPGKYDIIEFGKMLTLKFGDCARWIIQVYQNNYFIHLNQDNSVLGIVSADPFGNYLNGNEPEFKSCKKPPKVPVPLPNPNLYPIMIGSADPVSTGETIENNEINNGQSHIFRNVTPDSGTNLIYTIENRYYSSVLGRFITPNVNEFSKDRDRVFTNPYALETRNTLNFYTVNGKRNSDGVEQNVLLTRNVSELSDFHSFPKFIRSKQ